MGAAAVMGGAMDSLMNNTANAEHARRASTPGSSGNTGGGFSSIFNLKSVISAATKTAPPPAPQPAPPTSNFYVSSPPVAPEPIAVDLHSQTHAASPQKSVQGIVGCFRGYSGCFFCFPVFCAVSKLFCLSFDEILF